MELDLLLSDLAHILKEEANLKLVEERLRSVYNRLPREVSDPSVIILGEGANVVEDMGIEILPEKNEVAVHIIEDDIIVELEDETQVISLDASNIQLNQEDIISITGVDPAPEQIPTNISEFRKTLENSISLLEDFIRQSSQLGERINQNRQRLSHERQAVVQEHNTLTAQEQNEHQRLQNQLASNLNQLNTRLQSAKDELKKWWILPDIFPFFFKKYLDSVKRLNQQINSTSNDLQKANTTLASMLEWHKSQERAGYHKVNVQLSELEQNYRAETQRIMQNIQAIYLQCDEEILPEYRRLLGEWFTYIAKKLRNWHLDFSEDMQMSSIADTVRNPGLRVGTLKLNQYLEEAPAVLDPIGNHKHIFIQSGVPPQRNNVLHNLLLRLVLAFPIGMARLLLIDRVEQGRAFSLYSSRLHIDLASEKIFDNDREIEDQILNIRTKTSQIIQTKLSNYRNIDEFNIANPDVKTPYQFIVISNFPSGFSSQALMALSDILRNGPRTGTYVIASVSDQLPERDFDLSDFTSGNYKLSLLDPETIAWNSEYLSEINVAPDNNLSEQTISRLLTQITNTYQNKPTAIAYDRVTRDISLWAETTTKGLNSPVGLTFGGQVQEIQFNDDVAHGLIGGITGSGKTVLIHDIVCGLAQYHHPEELELYLLDFQGTEFDVYAKKKLPHARVVAVDCDPEVGFEIIRELNQEMDRRNELFNKADVKNIQEYKEKGNKLPRILLVIDEVQYIIQRAPNARIERMLETDLIDLFRRGRSKGIHVLIGTQSPSGVLTSAMVQQLKMRICMMADPSVSNLVLGSTNDGAVGLQKKGEAVYNENFGNQALNKFFRAAFLPRETVSKLVEKLHKKADEAHFVPPKSVYYFTGASTETILKNRIIKDKIHQHELGDTHRTTSIIIPLGNAIGPKEDISLQLRRERYGNAILLGGGGDSGGRTSGTKQLHHLFANSLLAACVQMSVQHSQFFLLDLTSPDSPYADRLRVFRKMPHKFQFAYNSQVASDILKDVREILTERKEQLSAGKPAEETIILAIFGAENFNDLRSGDRYSPSETRKHLEEILKDGPLVGIHTLLAAQTLAKGDILKADEFGARVALQVSENDSRILFDSEDGMTLGEKRGIYRRREWKKAEKFKFYIPLHEDDICAVAQKLTDN
jgi:hypothetical protein